MSRAERSRTNLLSWEYRRKTTIFRTISTRQTT
nr:MAG TPA: hypothetical protein [Caudoviricetes sp.]